MVTYQQPHTLLLEVFSLHLLRHGKLTQQHHQLYHEQKSSFHHPSFVYEIFGRHRRNTRFKFELLVCLQNLRLHIFHFTCEKNSLKRHLTNAWRNKVFSPVPGSKSEKEQVIFQLRQIVTCRLRIYSLNVYLFHVIDTQILITMRGLNCTV